MKITAKDGRKWELTEVDRSAGYPSYRFFPVGGSGEIMWLVEGEIAELEALGYKVER